MLAKAFICLSYIMCEVNEMAVEDFIKNATGFITHPGKQFEHVKRAPLSDAMVYGLVGLFIYGLLASLVATTLNTAMMPLGGSVVFVVMLLVVWLGGFVGTLVGSLWVHLWAYLFGARGIDKTIAIQFYANTPTYLLGWIPVVNLFTAIWSIVLLGIGLTKVHKLTTGQAIGTVLIAIIIPTILILIIVGLAVVAYMSSIGSVAHGYSY